MTTPPRRARALAALAGVSLAWAASGAGADGGPEFAPCRIGTESATARASCATLAVPLDPRDPGAGTLELALARVEARDRRPAADPLVFLAGGPGQSARDVWPSVAGAFADVTRRRDVLLIDQRGTGASRALDCPDEGPEAAPTLADPDTGDDGDAIAAAVAESRACLASLDADPALFTTSVAVADLERVRVALGIGRWNLYGVSYGTRVAMHYARRHPERARALILDAVVPPGVPLGADLAVHAQRALDRVFARCARERGCAEAFPDIAGRTRALVAALAEAPRTIVREGVASGRPERERFTREDLAATLRLLTYSAWGASLVPSMLHEAVEHDHFGPLARQGSMQSRALDAALATGMHHAVVCTEDLPFVDVEAAARAAADTYLGGDAIRALAAACGPWPRGRADDDLHAPLALELPALVLSGGADPITPPEFGEAVLAGLERARHVVNAGQGHMQAPLGCTPRLMARFLEEPDPATLPLDCLERLAPPPFFVDANGPLP